MNEERERMIVGWKIILDCELCKYIAINEFLVEYWLKGFSTSISYYLNT